MGLFNNIATFKHGIHPEYFKYLTDSKPVERMPFSKEMVLPLSQHIGAPSIPIVTKGQKVSRGEQIATANGFVSVALHAPVDGVIKAIGLREDNKGEMTEAIVIETDSFSTQKMEVKPLKPYQEMGINEFLSSIQNAGIVGLGGAAFPAHVKFSIPEEKSCKYLMLNGAECEPFLTSDHRMMVEYAQDIIEGIEILNHFIKAEKVFIGVEENKPDAVSNLSQLANHADTNIEVVPLQVKYPQGAEKMMITAILNREVPSGKLPLDVEVLVSNVSSIASVNQLFKYGFPLIERVVTLTGTAIARPANILVPIGTPISEVVQHCGGLTEENVRVIQGGPMMGMVQKSLDTPIVKGTSGLLFLTEREIGLQDEYSCIRCGKCVDACPMYLNPSLLGLLAKKGLWEEMQENHVLDCFECGSCSFVCPSGIPLVQSFRVGKGILKERKMKEVNG